jgi:hypothetical protein
MAFAMFNRSRLWVTDDEVDADFAALGISSGPRPAPGRRTALTAAQEVVGRFFFLQRAQAVQDGRTRQAYEFLHATFGEYLVARLVVREIRDGGMLRSLIGYEPLFARDTVPAFLHSMLAGRGDARQWLMPVLRQAMNRPDVPELTYRPVDRRIDHWMALYSLNLTLLVLACGEPLRASEIFPGEWDAPGELHRASGQWGAAMERSVFGGFLDVITVGRLWDGRQRDIELEFSHSTDTEPVDPWWTHGRDEYRTSAPPGTVVTGFTTADHAAKSLHLGGGIGSDMMRHALEPLTSEASEALTTFVVHEDGSTMSSALHDVLALCVASANSSDHLTQAYDRAAASLSRLDFRATRHLGVLVLSRMAADAPRLVPERIIGWLEKIAFALGYPPTLAPWMLECLTTVDPPLEIGARILGKAVNFGDLAPAWFTSAELSRIAAALALLDEYVAEADIGDLVARLSPDALGKG